MEKRAVVEVGRTPSVHSGRPSDLIKDDEAVCADELEKRASLRGVDVDVEDEEVPQQD